MRGRYCSFRCYRRSKQETSIERKVREALIDQGVEVLSEFKIKSANKRDVFDLYAPRLNLLIECDGNYWHAKPEVKIRDAAKSARAIHAGFNVARLSEDEIMSRSFHQTLATVLLHALHNVDPKTSA